MEDSNTLGSQTKNCRPVVKYPTCPCNHSCNAGGDSDEKYLSSFPRGWRFAPTEQELLYYLAKKVSNKPLPPNKIKAVNLYAYGPEELLEKYRVSVEQNEWYFFTPRERKYRNGSRPKRAAGEGYWKATGVDKPICKKGKKVGSKKTLVYYAGKPSKGIKTNFIMHEYVLDEGSEGNSETGKKNMTDDDHMRLNAWVLCKIHKKLDNNSPKKNDDQMTPKESNLKADLVDDEDQLAVVESKGSNLPPMLELATVANEEESSFQLGTDDDDEWDASILYHYSFDSLSPAEYTGDQPYNNQSFYYHGMDFYDCEEQKYCELSQVEVKCMPNLLSASSMTTLTNDMRNNQMHAPQDLTQAPNCPIW